MKTITYILKLAGFQDTHDFWGTYYPLFASVATISISIGSVVGFFELYSGLSIMMWVFMVLGVIVDLAFGIIANLYYLNQKFDTTRFIRGIFKASVLFVVIFLTNIFKLGIEGSNIKPEILKDPFIYITATIHYSFVLLLGIYVLLSIAENMAKMEIAVAISLTKMLKVKIKKIENITNDENDISPI